MSSIGSMNTTIKNNRNLLNKVKRKPFSKSLGGHSKSSDYKAYVLPEVSPHVLRRIRIKVKREQRRLLIKKLIISFVTLIIMYFYIQYIIK